MKDLLFRSGSALLEPSQRLGHERVLRRRSGQRLDAEARFRNRARPENVRDDSRIDPAEPEVHPGLPVPSVGLVFLPE